MSTFQFEIIDNHLDLDYNEFDCNVPPLNEYLKKHAVNNHSRGISKLYVAISNNNLIAGYYCISSSNIESHQISEDLKKGLPKYPLPAILIGRLAVDINFRGKGLGKELLLNAFERTIELSNKVGVFAVLVDAKDDNAAEFYKKYGFIEFKQKKDSLYLPIETIKKTFI